jgi:peptidoglycan/LPS O-acetylase OafA/YrhL
MHNASVATKDPDYFCPPASADAGLPIVTSAGHCHRRIADNGKPPLKKRYEELDALRGLAAMSVVFLHYYLVSHSGPHNPWIEYGPFRLLIAGGEAVVLFFVLSGLVLSLPFYDCDKPVAYGSFLVKRVARIYLPYCVSLFLAWFLIAQLQPQGIPSLSPWFNARWTTGITAAELRGHFSLIGFFNTQEINPVIWSLVHEMRISLIFPLIAWVVATSGRTTIALLLVILAAGSLVSGVLWGGDANSIINSVNYTGMFILGALIGKHRKALQGVLARISNTWKLVILAVGVLVYVYAKPSFLLSFLYEMRGLAPVVRTVIDSWCTAAGAVLIIFVALGHDGFSRILRGGTLNYLGKISYSLYLLHLPVLYGIVYSLHNAIGVWPALWFSFACTIVIACVSYHLIEKPSISLGRAITTFCQR